MGVNSRILKGSLALLSMAAGVGMLFAHGDLHERIIALTGMIGKDPKNPELFHERAELHRAHREWDFALADFDQALLLGSDPAPIHLGKAKLFLEAGWPKSGLQSVDQFLKKIPEHAEALVIRARLNVKLTNLLEAATNYSRAIALPNGGKPEYYIERAEALAAAGTNSVAEAIRGLDDGIARLGPLVTLELKAIELERESGRYDSALKRVDRLTSQSPRKESWLAQRGDLLLDAGRKPEARTAYEMALKALDTLPESRRNVRATLELEKKIKTQLEKTK